MFNYFLLLLTSFLIFTLLVSRVNAQAINTYARKYGETRNKNLYVRQRHRLIFVMQMEYKISTNEESVLYMFLLYHEFQYLSFFVLHARRLIFGKMIIIRLPDCCDCYYLNFNAGNLNSTNSKWSATWTDNLKRDLLVNYDKYARPSDFMNATKLSFRLTIRHIDLDELKALMTVYGWLYMQWNDEKLKWNEADYGNLSVIHMGDHEIWQPDLTLYNSASGNSVDNFGNSYCIVNHSGTVIWVPPAQFQVFCELDLRFWPFDTQTCRLVFGSWTYSALQVDVDFKDSDTPVIDTSIENHEWAIKGVTSMKHSKIYPCCVEPYVDVEYNITIERRSPMYKTVVITPATCIILMTLTCFWLPPQSGEKIILNGVNAIIISIFMMYFAQQLPVMAFHTPLIVLFYSSSLYLVSISMVISVIVIFMAKSKQTRPVPWLIKNVLDGPVGTILCVSHLNYQKTEVQQRGEELRDQPFEDHSTAEDHQMINNSSKNTIQNDWIIFATAIDRIFFFIYCLAFILLAIVYAI